jgi:hypothetical protein
MSRAKDDMMDTLHLITAETLSTIIREGITVLDSEGNQVKQPAPAAYIAAAIKFLKDNGITAEPESDRLRGTAGAVSNLPTFDEDAEDDRAMMN